jgi:hypothetical protein
MNKTVGAGLALTKSNQGAASSAPTVGGVNYSTF